MGEIASILNIATALSGLMLCLLGGVVLHIMRRMDKKTIRFFGIVLLVLGTYILASIIGLMIGGRTERIWVVTFRITVFLEFLCGYLLVLLLSLYLLDTLDHEGRMNRLRFYLCCYFVFECMMLIVSQFTGLYYSFGADNVYRRNPDTYWITSALSIVVLALDTVLYYVNLKKLSISLRYAFAMYLILPLIGMVAQNFLYELHIPILLAIFCTMAMFVYVLYDNTEQYVRQERVNTEMREAIMLSQIQPHFLFNALGAIRELIHSDTAKAEDAIVHFSQFLRGNMDSLQAATPIPFTEELNHTRNYLALEEMRFGDMLRVEYDIAVTDFRIPALTLQPIVENAVRHGVRKNEDGGCITVSTRAEKNEWVVEVADDGPGFDPKQPRNDGRSHIGIDNVRGRLAQLCRGRLEIDSAPGHGTRVLIRIPKGAK